MGQTWEKLGSWGHWPQIFWWIALLKVEIFWNFYLYYTNCSFKYTFEPFKRCFLWQTTHNCGYIKLSICGNLRFTRNVASEGLELFSCLGCGVFLLLGGWGCGGLQLFFLQTSSSWVSSYPISSRFMVGDKLRRLYWMLRRLCSMPRQLYWFSVCLHQLLYPAHSSFEGMLNKNNSPGYGAQVNYPWY